MVLGAGFLAWLLTRGFRVGDLPNADFFDFYAGAAAIRDGADLYRVNDGGYIYPPLLAVALRPLTLLEPATAAHVWTLLLAVLLAACAWLMADEAQQRLGLGFSRLRTAALASLVVVLLGLTWKSEFQWGNSNLLVLLPTILALRWAGRRRLLCGGALALSVSIKYLTIATLPYLLLRRRWTEAGAFVVGVVVLLMLPAIVLGWEANLRYLGVAFHGLLEMVGATPKGAGANIHDVASGYSLSITSVLAREARSHGEGGTRLYVELAIVLATGMTVAFASYASRGFSFFARHGRRDDAAPSGRVLVLVEWSVLLAAALLFSPQTQHRHLNMLMPLATTAVALAVASRGWSRWMLVGSLALATLGATAIPGVPGWREATERWNQGGGAAACVAVLLLATLWAGVRWARMADDTPNRPGRTGAQPRDRGAHRGSEPA